MSSKSRAKTVFEAVFEMPAVTPDLPLPVYESPHGEDNSSEDNKSCHGLVKGHIIDFGQNWSAHGFSYIFQVGNKPKVETGTNYVATDWLRSILLYTGCVNFWSAKFVLFDLIQLVLGNVIFIHLHRLASQFLMSSYGWWLFSSHSGWQSLDPLWLM